MLISYVYEVALRSLSWAPGGLNELLEVCFKFPFNLILFGIIIENGFFHRPFMACIQIMVPRWGPRTMISALFHRQT